MRILRIAVLIGLVAVPAMAAAPPAYKLMPVKPAPVGGQPETREQGLIIGGTADQKCDDMVLASISGWPESKVEMELYCVDLGFLGKACTDLPRVYARDCRKEVVARLCYPDDGEAQAIQAAKDCAIAGTAAAVGACIASGCAGA